MKKTLPIIILTLIATSILYSCDSEKSRQEKAQTLILDSLKEELPDIKSYEAVSTTLDSLPDNLWFCDTILVDADNLMNTYIEIYSEKYDMENIKDNIEAIKKNAQQRMFRNMMYGSEWLITPENFEDTNRIKQLQKRVSLMEESITLTTKQLDEMALNLQRQIKTDIDSINFTGYKVTHKFRAKDMSGNMQLFSRIYIIDKDFKKIYRWGDSEDTQKLFKAEKIIKLVKSFDPKVCNFYDIIQQSQL